MITIIHYKIEVIITLTVDRGKIVKCDYFNNKICHSCDLLNLSYDDQIIFKKNHFNTLWNDCNSDFIRLRAPIYSRARAKFAVGGDIQNPILGYINGLSIVDNCECPLHFPVITEVAKKIKSLIPKHNLIPFNLNTQKGELKHLIISSNYAQDEVMVRIVLRSKEARERAIKAFNDLKATMPKVRVGSINYNPKFTSIIEGETEELVSPDEHIVEVYNGNRVFIGVSSFFQVTPEMAQILYQDVADLVAQFNITNLLDLYCGVGGFSLHCAHNSKIQIVGRELSQYAVASATKSASLHGFYNLKFEVCDLESIINLEGFDSIVLNPPRRGLSDQMIRLIESSKIRTIFYSSCNPSGQKDELEKLLNCFKVVKRIGFDMFPNSSHYEALVILERY